MKNKKPNYAIIYMAMLLLLLLLAAWNVAVGSIDISIGNIMRILGGMRTDETAYRVVWDIRLPRIVAAIMLGGALSVSGFLLQTFFQNPIAGPYVLGISSGAKLFVAFYMIAMLDFGRRVSSLGMVSMAFVGSVLVTGFVLLIATKVKRMSMLIVCGILTGYICSAITDLCVTFASDANIVNLHNWSLGSLSGMDWNDCFVMTVIVVISLIAAFFMSKPIGAYQMGEEYALNMGVNVRNLRVAIILLSSVLSACATAFAGPISFVGIAVPHLVKTLTKTAKPLIHIPACFLGGAIVTLMCDGLARMIFAPTELSISSVTAVLLVPVIIVMMVRTKGGRDE